MKTWIDPTIDRRGWTSGEWNDEPDKVQWTDEATGLVCLAKRNHFGAWCGYIGVPLGHPWHGKDYGAVDADVHGGLTFADTCQEGPPEETVCHVPAPGEPDDLWWLGFDCGHIHDLCPDPTMYKLGIGIDRSVYRTLAYVQNECRDLARQAKAV